MGRVWGEREWGWGRGGWGGGGGGGGGGGWIEVEGAGKVVFIEFA